MIKKNYTRKQIEEALKYWTEKLRLLNESITKTVDALISEFGEARVVSSEKTYRLSKADLQKIYDILNASLFGGTLGKIRLEYWPEGFIIDRLDENARKSGVFDQKTETAKCYGVFSGVCKDIKNERGTIVDIGISEEIIMINKTYLTDCIFIFAVASICHEMIHFADRFSDEFHEKMLFATRTNTNFDSHKDKVFQDKMAEANAEGIHVVERIPKDEAYDTSNDNALFTLKNTLGEDDNEQSDVIKNDHMLIMRGNGSSTFMFAEFD